MTRSTASGPCGLSIADIIALAARQSRLISRYGILPTDEIVATIDTFGRELTRAWRETAGEAVTADFAERSAVETPKVLRALTTHDAMKGCRSIAWSDAPSTAADDDMTWFEPFAEDIDRLRLKLGASPADMLDLLVWIQGVLMLPRIIGDPSAPPASAFPGSGTRRERRIAKTRSRNRRRPVPV